jgi:hypothetical protein
MPALCAGSSNLSRLQQPDVCLGLSVLVNDLLSIGRPLRKADKGIGSIVMSKLLLHTRSARDRIDVPNAIAGSANATSSSSGDQLYGQLCPGSRVSKTGTPPVAGTTPTCVFDPSFNSTASSLPLCDHAGHAVICLLKVNCLGVLPSCNASVHTLILPSWIR